MREPAPGESHVLPASNSPVPARLLGGGLPLVHPRWPGTGDRLQHVETVAVDINVPRVKLGRRAAVLVNLDISAAPISRTTHQRNVNYVSHDASIKVAPTNRVKILRFGRSLPYCQDLVLAAGMSRRRSVTISLPT